MGAVPGSDGHDVAGVRWVTYPCVHGSVPHDSLPAAAVLARIVRSMLPTDAELRQGWQLWQEPWVRALRDAAARDLVVDLYDQLHAWVAGV